MCILHNLYCNTSSYMLIIFVRLHFKEDFNCSLFVVEYCRILLVFMVHEIVKYKIMVHRPCPNSRVDSIVNEKILREKCLLDSSYWLEKFHIENFSLVTEHRTEQDTVYLNILPQIDVL